MENHIDKNFGSFVCNTIKELQEIHAKTLSENGKNDDEISAYFESDEYSKIYIDTCFMLIDSLSSSLEEYLIEDAKEERKLQNLYFEHLQSIWGQGFSWMRQYRVKCMDICDGYGWYINQSHIVSDRRNVFNALCAIHGKALLVYAEIICLLENGFTDGAFAHYRTLYELWAVAEFLNNDTDDVSAAFINSANNKSNSETGHYKWAKISKRFSDCEGEVNISNIVAEAHKTFKEGLKQEVSNTKLKNIYTFPNLIIHPSAQGVFGRTSCPDTGIGLATPAINSSMVMGNITRMFLFLVPCPVSSIGVGLLDTIIRKRIVPFFEETEQTQKEIVDDTH